MQYAKPGRGRHTKRKWRCPARGGIAPATFRAYDDGMTAPQEPRRPGLIHRAGGQTGRVEQLGPYGIESLIDREEEGAATAYRVTVRPHSRTSISRHRVAEEFYFVIRGRGTAILDGREHALGEGDFLRLPPGTDHGFVTGDEALVMLDIHTPGCRPDRDTYFPEGPVPEGFAPATAQAGGRQERT